jgi:glycosyltransferase involved in cell wall biosynthesis|tara:strand:+ start:302 stop:1054 length:753 start_codon:yes stop_codon:yes gene_type:complete
MLNDNHFTVLVPAYNVEKWAERNISSVIEQDYTNYDIAFIDDCSTDKTFEIVENKLTNLPSKHFNLCLEKNSFNKGKMQNAYDSIHKAKDNTIIVILDGDDWFPNKNVLKYLNEVYNSSDVWMTNGSYIIEPTKQVISPKINETYWNGIIRHKSWEFSHLGTFKKELFCKVKRKDFMNKRGEYWATTSDQAIMWPMAEMAGPEHFKAIDEVLYVYNRLNPLSDDRAHRQDQLLTEQIIRNKKPYLRLETL